MPPFFYLPVIVGMGTINVVLDAIFDERNAVQHVPDTTVSTANRASIICFSTESLARVAARKKTKSRQPVQITNSHSARVSLPVLSDF